MHMIDPHCRIRSISYKKSPHLVEVFPRKRDTDVVKKMRRYFDDICGYYPDGCAGMVVVAWDFDGHWARATNIHKDSFVGQTLLPAFIGDILRRDTMKDVIHDTIIFRD